MRKFLLVFGISVLGLSLFSCLDNEYITNVHYSYKGIDSVSIQDQAHAPGEIIDIKTYFTRNSACEAFFDYDYVGLENGKRYVRVVTSEIIDDNCPTDTLADSRILKFKPRRAGSYTFYFWKENDEETGQPVYIEKIVEVH